MAARYWIAQYVPDVFRNEPRNIGVLVLIGNRLDGRFLGETSPGRLDGRRLRTFHHTSVYRQWVEFWRREIRGGDIDSIVGSSGSHYRIVDGGEVDNAPVTELPEVVSYLYSMLVAEGGVREALGSPSDATVLLHDEVLDSLRDLQLVDAEQPVFVRHPIRQHVAVTGQFGVRHQPAFVQENGALYVMETVDFSTSHRRRARDHAGWSAYMFSDIRRARQSAKPIAIVRHGNDDLNDEEVRYGLSILKHEAEVVNWAEGDQRHLFLEERRRIAVSVKE